MLEAFEFILSLAGILLSVVELFVNVISVAIAVVVFIVTFRSDKKATEEQTYRESVRATLSDFAELRRAHQDFDANIKELEGEEKDKLIKSYLADLERFATGCNLKAYDVEVLNSMSGGLLVNQYKKYFKPYIAMRRGESDDGHYVKNSNLYIETEKMIHEICRIRGIDDV